MRTLVDEAAAPERASITRTGQWAGLVSMRGRALLAIWPIGLLACVLLVGPGACDSVTPHEKAEANATSARAAHWAELCGIRTEAPAVVYVFDYTPFGMRVEIQDALAKSVDALGPEQLFHAIRFACSGEWEMPSMDLVPATRENKEAFKDFQERLLPRRTHGVPALERAFAAFAKPEYRQRRKVLFLIMDSDFDDEQGAIETIRRGNARGHIHIHTVLFGMGDRSADVMKRIAAENDGEFRAVKP